MALAEAELGRCAEAARWQQTAIESLGSAATAPGAADRQAAMRARLARYRRGAPCRPES
jgi:hypothetical protein